MKLFVSFFLTLLCFGSFSFAQDKNETSNTLSKEYYKNPIINVSTPDPTVIQGKNYYYLYSTEDIRNVPIYRSKDLVNWELTGTAFDKTSRPSFEPKGGIWAPDINKIGNQYVLYYSMSVWGGEWTCGIGVATANSPEGPFVDHGKLFRSNEIKIQNCIDPFFIREKGKNYLMFGSFHGIYAVELTSDGLALKDKEPVQIAGTAYEGTYIHKHKGYYYLFASTGTCCEGAKSTYSTVVARSKKLFGPYLDKSGRPMMENHHETVIHNSDRFVGTGHNSEIITDKNKKDWIFYHAYDKTHPDDGRMLLMDQVHWEKGWPYIENSVPSIQALAPELSR